MVDTWDRGTVRWYWSADILFWQLSIDHNIDVQLVFPGFPNWLESARVNIGFPVVRTDGRSFVRCTVTWLPNFLGWIDYLSYGAPPTLALRAARGAPLLCIGQIEASTSPPPPRHTPAFDTFPVPGRREFDYQSLPGGGEIWSPCFRGGGFELHPRFHVKSLAWRAIMGDAVLEDFRGKDCAFVANWLRGKGLNKLCAVFEVFKFWNF